MKYFPFPHTRLNGQKICERVKGEKVLKVFWRSRIFFSSINHTNGFCGGGRERKIFEAMEGKVGLCCEAAIFSRVIDPFGWNCCFSPSPHFGGGGGEGGRENTQFCPLHFFPCDVVKLKWRRPPLSLWGQICHLSPAFPYNSSSYFFTVWCSCGFPGAPAHSSVEFNTARVRPGTVARYSCDRGFELLGPAR